MDFSKKWLRNHKKFLLHFLIHIDVLMPCSKLWVRNHQNFLLHFLIHIDVLMLCSKFELIPTSIFRVTVIFKNEPKSDKITVL